MDGNNVKEYKKTSYSIYNNKAKKKTKINLLEELFPPLPTKKYSIIYADPPWDYGGKMQFDKSGKIEFNQDWNKDIFISGAIFKYPTLDFKTLETLNVSNVSEKNSLLFLWTTSPHLKQAIDLGIAWGFDYKTVAFVWDKQVHNPGQYTLSYCELCLIFKKGKIPSPRGARNIKQLVSVKRTKHSEKPLLIAENIEKMFPTQTKLELFSRDKKYGWDCWGLEKEFKSKMASQEDVLNFC